MAATESISTFRSGVTTRSLQILTLLACSSLLATQASPGRTDVDEATAAKVKAAYLYNFVKFVKWPDDAFEDENAPVVIGVVGKDPFGPILDRTVQDKKVGRRQITVKRIKAPGDPGDPDASPGGQPPGPSGEEPVAAELRGCHVVYISGAGEEWFRQALEPLHRSPVLTVSDIRAFAREGGMIEFVLDGERIVFHINRKVAEEARLRMSAKLLDLATIVESPKTSSEGRPNPARHPS